MKKKNCSKAYEHLCTLHLERQGSFPYPVKYKHKPNSANGLTRCVIDYVKYRGGHAERVNTMGVFVQPKAVEGIKQRGYYRKTSGTKGSADIHCLINGKSIMLEIKYGRDRQSEDQKEYQKRIERNGGHYKLVNDFDDFVEWINCFFKIWNTKK